jgi:hypothetical protein
VYLLKSITLKSITSNAIKAVRIIDSWLPFFDWGSVLNLIFYTAMFGVYPSGYTFGVLLNNSLVRRSLVLLDLWIPRYSYVIQLDCAGYRHYCTYILRDAPRIMSLQQTYLFSVQCDVLVPIYVGFYIRSNPTILK